MSRRIIPAPARSRHRRPLTAVCAIEPMENRTLLSTVVVNTVLDQTDPSGSDTVSLRDAVAMADSSSGVTTITFDPTVFATAQTISLTQGTRLEMSQSTTIVGPAAGLTVSGDDLTRSFFVESGATVSMSGLTITDGHGNDNNGDGGGIYVAVGGTLSLTDVTLSDNTGAQGSHGGGLANYGTADLSDVNVTGNSVTVTPGNAFSGQGGGIYNAGTMTVDGGIVSGNKSGLGGGGIFNAGQLALTNVSILSNTAEQAFGGGLQNQGLVNGDAAATLTDVTVSGNSAASGSAGGIGSDLAGQSGGGTTSITMTNVTVTGNSAAQVGGGVWLDQYITGSSLVGVTIAGNTAVGDGGGFYDAAGSGVTVGNTIVAGNSITGSGSTGPDVSGTVDSLGNNLIGAADGSSGWTGTDLTGSVAAPLNADLGPLADNGGPTETLLPQTGSPAINSGSTALIPSGVTTDQRGLPRTVTGTVDIGAVESGDTVGTTTASVAITASANAISVGGPVMFTATVSGTSSTPTGTVTFLDGGTALGTQSLNGSGVATFTTTALPAGSDSITASYGGDETYAAAVSAAVTVSVSQPVGTPAATVSTLTSSANIFPVGDFCYLTCTVAQAGGTGPAPTGTVTIEQNGVAKTTETLTNGSVTFKWYALDAGPSALDSFVYSGDSTYAASTSNTIDQSYPALSQLSASIRKAVIPSANVAGQPLNARVPVSFTNTGMALTGTYTVVLYADTSTGGLSGNQVALETVTRRTALKAGRSLALTLAAKKLPSGLTPGTYYLLVEVTDPLGDSNIVDTSQTITVAAPFVTLAASMSTIKPAVVQPGKVASTVVTLTNDGNIAAAGPVTLTLDATVADGTSASTNLTTFNRNISIKPGKSVRITLRFRPGSDVSAGIFTPILSALFGGSTVTADGPTFEVG